MSQSGNLVCLDDFEQVAARKLPKDQYDYYRSGAFDETTLRLNRKAFERIRIIPRILRDVKPMDLTCSLLGLNFSLPVGMSPAAFQRMAHPDGELASAKAAGNFNIPFTVSFATNTSIATLAKDAASTVKWFQMFIMRDPELTKRLVRLAEEADFKAIVLTVDFAMSGCRRADWKNKFTLPPHLKWAIFDEESKSVETKEGFVAHQAIAEKLLKPVVLWEDIKWLKSIARIPVILKGILSPEDALIAVECGADAIIVSNHGGRHMDSIPPTIEALPKVVKAVNCRVPVIIDGGFRQGTDIFKALALGANFVMVGRPILWGLAVDGQKGVEDVLKILKKELTIAMSYAGCKKIGDIEKIMVANEYEYCKF